MGYYKYKRVYFINLWNTKTDLNTSLWHIISKFKLPYNLSFIYLFKLNVNQLKLSISKTNNNSNNYLPSPISFKKVK